MDSYYINFLRGLWNDTIIISCSACSTANVASKLTRVECGPLWVLGTNINYSWMECIQLCVIQTRYLTEDERFT